MFKLWDIGSIAKKEGLDQQEFTHIEAPSGEDINNHITLQRTFRNLYELHSDTYEVLNNLIKKSTRGEGVFEAGDFAPEVIDIDSVKYFRVKPGVAFTGEKIFVNRPLCHNASRQLEVLLNLNVSAPSASREYLEIKFEDSLFSAEAKVNGKTKSFVDKATGFELLKALRADPDFSSILSSSSVDLTEIKLEPLFKVSAGGNLRITPSGELEFSDSSTGFILYTLNSAGSIDSDKRKALLNYNEFESGITLYQTTSLPNRYTEIRIKGPNDEDAILKWDQAEEQFDFNKKVKIDGELFATEFNGATISSKKFNGATIDEGNINGVAISGESFNGATINSEGINGAIIDKGKYNGATINSAGINGATINSEGINGAIIDKGKYNGLTIETTDKVLDLSKASLTVGTVGKTGKIVLQSNNTKEKTITINESTKLLGTLCSYQLVEEVEVATDSITIPTTAEFKFNKLTDTLIVFENLVYFLKKGADYKISSDGKKIEKEGGNFVAGTYVFLILKNIPMG